MLCALTLEYRWSRTTDAVIQCTLRLKPVAHSGKTETKFRFVSADHRQHCFILVLFQTSAYSETKPKQNTEIA